MSHNYAHSKGPKFSKKDESSHPQFSKRKTIPVQVIKNSQDPKVWTELIKQQQKHRKKLLLQALRKARSTKLKNVKKNLLQLNQSLEQTDEKSAHALSPEQTQKKISSITLEIEDLKKIDAEKMLRSYLETKKLPYIQRKAKRKSYSPEEKRIFDRFSLLLHGPSVRTLWASLEEVLVDLSVPKAPSSTDSIPRLVSDGDFKKQAKRGETKQRKEKVKEEEEKGEEEEEEEEEEEDKEDRDLVKSAFQDDEEDMIGSDYQSDEDLGTGEAFEINFDGEEFDSENDEVIVSDLSDMDDEDDKERPPHDQQGKQAKDQKKEPGSVRQSRVKPTPTPKKTKDLQSVFLSSLGLADQVPVQHTRRPQPEVQKKPRNRNENQMKRINKFRQRETDGSRGSDSSKPFRSANKSSREQQQHSTKKSRPFGADIRVSGTFKKNVTPSRPPHDQRTVSIGRNDQGFKGDGGKAKIFAKGKQAPDTGSLDLASLHPSWAQKLKEKQALLAQPQGKKIVFGDD